MITEAMLREAAHRASEVYTAYYEKDYDPKVPYAFPPEFEKKIDRLTHRAKHPVFYKAMRCMASIAIAMIITGSAWITVDAEAKAVVIGWVKEVYETYFVLRHDGADTAPESADYRPAWLPDGYSELRVNASETRTVVVYANEAGELIRFSFIRDSEETDWFIDVSRADIKKATVNGKNADLLIAHNPKESNAIAWISDGTAFYVTGFVSENDLVQMAESVQIKK